MPHKQQPLSSTAWLLFVGVGGGDGGGGEGGGGGDGGAASVDQADCSCGLRLRSFGISLFPASPRGLWVGTATVFFQGSGM